MYTFSRLALVLLFSLALTACDSNDPAEPGDGISQEVLDDLADALGCDIEATISVNQSRNESLSSSDCDHFSASDDSKIDYIAFEISESTSATIIMESNDFDTFLYLFNSNGDVHDVDDDSHSGTDSEINTALSPGVYVIGANTFESVQVLGDYSVELLTD